MSLWQHTVAILIGGQSERMGEPKHLLSLPSGESLLDAMRTVAAQIAKQTVVVGGQVDGVSSIQDHRKNAGPVAGIEALLHSNLDEKYLVIGCDMPHLRPADVSMLLESTTPALFAHGIQMFGLPVVIHNNNKDACTAYLDRGGGSILGFMESIEHQIIQVDAATANVLSSINTRVDFDEFALKEGRS